MFSFMSDSTKMGEIPEHRWILPPAPEEPIDEMAAWPGYGMLEQVEQKSKGRFGALKFWKKKSDEG